MNVGNRRYSVPQNPIVTVSDSSPRGDLLANNAARVASADHDPDTITQDELVRRTQELGIITYQG